MTRFKRLLLTALCITVLVADGLNFFGRPIVDENGIVSAGLLPCRTMKKQFDEFGNFKGCNGNGDDCWTLPTPIGTVTVSSAGLHLQ